MLYLRREYVIIKSTLGYFKVNFKIIKVVTKVGHSTRRDSVIAGAYHLTVLDWTSYVDLYSLTL